MALLVATECILVAARPVEDEIENLETKEIETQETETKEIDGNGGTDAKEIETGQLDTGEVETQEEGSGESRDGHERSLVAPFLGWKKKASTKPSDILTQVRKGESVHGNTT